MGLKSLLILILWVSKLAAFVYEAVSRYNSTLDFFLMYKLYNNICLKKIQWKKFQ